MFDIQTDQDAGMTGEGLEAFLSDLSELCRKCGFAIADSPHVFLMEKEDYMFSYVCDGDGRLVLA